MVQVITPTHNASVDFHQLLMDVFIFNSYIVIFHDNEPSGPHRSDTGSENESRKVAVPSINRHPSSATDLFLTSISPGGNSVERARLQGNPAGESSVVSSRRSRLPKVWASRAPMGGPLADRRLISSSSPPTRNSPTHAVDAKCAGNLKQEYQDVILLRIQCVILECVGRCPLK
jgi:hypothetical protein